MTESQRFLTVAGYIGVVFIGFHAILFAAEPLPSSQVNAAVVTALLERLESNLATERAAAAKELQSLGTGVLPLLPPPDRMETAAARDVVIRVRNVLERQLAKESSQASVVTLDTTAGPAELLQAINSQTGNRIAFLNQDSREPLRVDWKSRSFWDAIDDVLAKSKGRVLWNGERAQFLIEPRIADALPSNVAHAGPFRVEAVVGALKTAENIGQDRLFRVKTQWQIEPRLRPLFLRIKPSDWHGNSANGQVTPWNPEAEYELPFADGTRQLSWPLDLIWPQNVKPETWSLHGKAVVHLAAMTETLIFDPVALRPNVQRRRGGVAVRIRTVDFRPDDEGRLSATIRILVSYDTGGPAFESHRAGVFYQAASLLGPKGERLPFTDYDATQESDGAVGAEYRFRHLSGNRADYRFVYDAPTLFVDVPCDVAFRDLLAPE